MFKKMKVKKAHLKGTSKESINKYECSRSSDKNDMLSVVKCKKQKVQLESTDVDLTVESDCNATLVSLPGNVECESKIKSKKKKRKLETKDDLNIIIESDKISKKKKKAISTDNDVHKTDHEGVAVNDEIPIVESPSSLNMKAARKKKKKTKSAGNEIIDEHEYKKLDEFIGELDEESNAQYDNWVNQIDSILKKSV